MKGDDGTNIYERKIPIDSLCFQMFSHFDWDLEKIWYKVFFWFEEKRSVSKGDEKYR